MTAQATKKVEESIFDILRAIDQFDNSVDELDPQKLKDYISKLNLKVDNYKDVLDSCDARIEVLKKRIEELSLAKKQLENKKKAIRDCLVYAMETEGFKKLPGDYYQATLVVKDLVTIKDKIEPPDAKQYMKFPNFIKRSYSWSSADLIREIKANPEFELAGMGEKVKSKSIKFSIRKDLNK